MVRVQSCCCCGLKTGTLVIATLGWMFTLLQLFGMGFSAGKNFDQQQPDMITTTGSSEEKLPRSISSVILGFNIGYTVISFVVCILLIVGVAKKKSIFFVPYLVLKCLECIAAFIYTIMTFVFIFVISYPKNIVMGVAFVILIGVSMFCCYEWIVVYSYFHVVKDETEADPAPTG